MEVDPYSGRTRRTLISPRSDEVDLAVDRSLVDAADDGYGPRLEVGDAVGATLYDAYGDIVDTPAEIDELGLYRGGAHMAAAMMHMALG